MENNQAEAKKEITQKVSGFNNKEIFLSTNRK